MTSAGICAAFNSIPITETFEPSRKIATFKSIFNINQGSVEELIFGNKLELLIDTHALDTAWETGDNPVMIAIQNIDK